MADLKAAIMMVTSGHANSVTLCGLPGGRRLLSKARPMQVDGLAIEPMIRRGGGGIDIRVRRTRSVDT